MSSLHAMEPSECALIDASRANPVPEYYQIVHKNSIRGPYNVPEIVSKIIRKELDGKLWIRKCRRRANWYRLNLDQFGQFKAVLCNDDNFETECPQLFSAIENIKKLPLYYHDKYPGDDRDDTEATHSILCMLNSWTILNWILFIFLTIHINFSLPMAYLWHCCRRSKPYFVFCCVLGTLNAIATAICICYFGFIYTGIYEETQSWMIAYVGWILFIMIDWCATGIMEQYRYRKHAVWLNTIRMKILGISLQQKKILFTDWKEDLWMIPIACLLYSAVIGFVANFVLEEKFVLECDTQWKIGDICYDNGKACCVVVSSHDVSHMFDFLGRLASNILAAFATIRVVAWFMVKRNKKIRHLAEKSGRR